MDGYIIKSKDGLYLAQGMWWYPHKRNEDAHVFPKRILEAIKEIEWYESPPYYAIPARYTVENGVEIIGENFKV